MNCQYCFRPARQREGLEEVTICDSCLALLQNPVTALPLIRGHLTLTLRGTMPEPELKRKIDAFMQMIAGWKRPE